MYFIKNNEVDEEFLTLLDDIQSTKSLEVVYGHVIKRENGRGRKGDGIDGNLDAVYELYKYMSEHNYRVIDLMKWLDKDGSMSVSREEFKRGMMVSIKRGMMVSFKWGMLVNIKRGIMVSV